MRTPQLRLFIQINESFNSLHFPFIVSIRTSWLKLINSYFANSVPNAVLRVRLLLFFSFLQRFL
ncbi:MAG TPA: hypothetical protein DCL00_06895 [Opitutae bacterium]|nr:hypothetical protein [Opitutae bacterium]